MKKPNNQQKGQNEGPENERHIPPKFYSLSGMILIGIIIVLMVFIDCPSQNVVMILRIALAAAVAVYTFHLTGTLSITLHIGIKATAGFGMLIAVLTITPTVYGTSDKCQTPFVFSIYLRDSVSGIPIKDTGTILVKGEDYSQRLKIDNNGSVLLVRIPAKLRNTTTEIELDAQGWLLGNGTKVSKIKLIGPDTSLIVKRDNSLCCIYGYVEDSKTERFLSGVTARIGDDSDITKANGTFTIKIPAQSQSESYRLILDKKGYYHKEQDVFPQGHKEIPFALDPILRFNKF